MSTHMHKDHIVRTLILESKSHFSGLWKQTKPAGTESVGVFSYNAEARHHAVEEE